MIDAIIAFILGNFFMLFVLSLFAIAYTRE